MKTKESTKKVVIVYSLRDQRCRMEPPNKSKDISGVVRFTFSADNVVLIHFASFLREFLHPKPKKVNTPDFVPRESHPRRVPSQSHYGVAGNISVHLPAHELLDALASGLVGGVSLSTNSVRKMWQALAELIGREDFSAYSGSCGVGCSTCEPTVPCWVLPLKLVAEQIKTLLSNSSTISLKLTEDRTGPIASSTNELDIILPVSPSSTSTNRPSSTHRKKRRQPGDQRQEDDLANENPAGPEAFASQVLL